jgi:hypothetical protein
MTHIVRKRIVGTRREDVQNIFAQMKKQTKTVTVQNDHACPNCDASMVLDDIEYICTNCGMKGDRVEAPPPSYSNTHNKCYNMTRTSTIGNGPCNSLSDNGNTMYDAIMRRLTKMYVKSRDTHIPLEVLRQTARDYTELCQTLKQANDELGDGEKKIQRCNMLLPALLQQRLHKSNMSKPNAYICEFIGKSKSTLTKSVNKLEELMRSTIPQYRVDTTSKIGAFAYQFLARLDLDMSLTDLIVCIIARADVQVDMINFRTCQDKTKVVGTIWLLIRQIGYHILHNRINERCFRISKSTYVRYVDFLDVNRRRINPILVKNKVRPIPRRFAKQGVGRGRKKLDPIPEQYAHLFMTAK